MHHVPPHHQHNPYYHHAPPHFGAMNTNPMAPLGGLPFADGSGGDDDDKNKEGEDKSGNNPEQHSSEAV